MPRAGRIVVALSPLEADAIAHWLRHRPAPLIDLPRANAPTLENGVRVDIVKRMNAISRRERETSASTRVEVEFDHADASWFSAQIAGGMFGAGHRMLMPASVRSFCRRCAIACQSRRGPRRLHGDRLKIIVASGNVEERHLKRLRKRARDETAMREHMKSYAGSLARALIDEETKSP